MLLQSSLHHQKPSLSTTISYRRPLPWKNPYCFLLQTLNFRKLQSTCSISQMHNYGSMDYERRLGIRWNAIYRSISLMENPELGAGTVLNQMEKNGKELTKRELFRVVKELRKFKRPKQALEVYDWMNNKEERFRLSPSEAAIQLDLIAKVRGVSSAEDFFAKLPDTGKDRRTSGALLNSYARAKMREKAESLMDSMRDRAYATQALPFNVMMTLYMNLEVYDQVDMMIYEMMEKNIRLDIYSYNIWLSSCGSQGHVERMEQVFEQMKLDKTIRPDWTTFSTMATMYIKMGQLEKAEDSLRRAEGRIIGRDRVPYHHLLSLYGNVGNKEEVYRVWSVYKSSFLSIPNLGYHAIISSLVRMGDIEGAEKIYKEWLQIKTSYDPRIGNIFMTWYVKEGSVDEAKSFFNHMAEVGGKLNSNTWEILADGYIRERRISEALSCFKEAFLADGSKYWKPRPVIVSSFFKLCEEEADMESKGVLVDLLRQSGYLDDETWASVTGFSITRNELYTEKDRSDDRNDNEENEMIINELQDGL